MRANLLEMLVAEKMLSPEQAKAVTESAAASGLGLARQLVQMGPIGEVDLLKFLAEKLSLPVIKLTSIDKAALDRVPVEVIRKLRCVPFQIDPDNMLQVALADPGDLAGVETLSNVLGSAVAPVLTTFTCLDRAMKAIEGAAQQSSPPRPPPAAVQVATRTNVLAPRRDTEPARPSSSFKAQVKKFASQDTVTNILNQVLQDAIAKGASDVHVEPEPTHIRVRFRMEGALFDVYQIPIELKDQLVTRAKVISGLDISERRVPQDGRARHSIGSREVGFRVNVIPCLHGETVVFRVLRQDNLRFDLAKVGFDPEQLATFRNGISAPNGLVLVTGPTGSGKTTTLYSALSSLNETTVKIATLEDPIEYTLPGITQVQINKDTGLSFAEVLKSLLRQDPDVILLGEIRDQETAVIAVQAALTGHLVMTSLHTNDAPSAIVRLVNMGVEPYAAIEALATVVAQRLIRTVCAQCAAPRTITEEQRQRLGADRAFVEQGTFLRGNGCEHCLGSGYRGMVPIFEVLELTDSMKDLVLKGESLISLKRCAITSGMRTLRQSALRLVASGVTTLEEAIASTLEH